MNQIVKGLLSKFINELLCYPDMSDYQAMSESEQFENFINYIIIKRDFLDNFDLEDIYTGGKEDGGIDGIAITIGNNLISDIGLAKEVCENSQDISINFIFIQSKTSNSIDSGDVLKFFNGVENFFDKTESLHSKNRKILELYEIKDLLYTYSPNFSSNPQLYLKYAYNGTKDTLSEINGYKNKYKRKFEQLGLFSDISIDILDSDDIQDIYKEINLNIKKSIRLNKIVTLPTIEGIHSSYIGIISLSEFIKLVCDNDRIIRNLFYSNVRDFQGNTPVNKDIIQTMANDNDYKYFGLFHNGITIVAKTLRMTGENIQLENFQIVNGCQTSYIIAENKHLLKDNKINEMFIPIKLIATGDNNIINYIIKTTNRHNEVKIEAFESLKDYHKKLEEFYNAKNQLLNTKIYYERRSKQYSHNADANIKKNNVITLYEQIKTYLSMFVEVPQIVRRYYGELLIKYREKNKLFEKVKGKEHFELYHISSLALVKFNIYMTERKLIKKYKLFKYHILLLFKLMIASDLSVNSAKKEYKEYCQKLYDILEDDNKANDYFNKCCEIIDEAIIGSKEEKYNLNISVDFTNKIKDICKKKYN